jgi:hypothetical protein
MAAFLFWVEALDGGAGEGWLKRIGKVEEDG